LEPQHLTLPVRVSAQLWPSPAAIAEADTGAEAESPAPLFSASNRAGPAGPDLAAAATIVRAATITTPRTIRAFCHESALVARGGRGAADSAPRLLEYFQALGSELGGGGGGGASGGGGAAGGGGADSAGAMPAAATSGSCIRIQAPNATTAASTIPT